MRVRAALCGIIALASCHHDVAAPQTQVRPPPEVDEYAALEPLAKAIGGAHVVAIGEPNHAAGNLFSAQARLVRFLHDRLGFSVLAWEAGLWTCEADAAHCVGFPWGAVIETRSVRPPPKDMAVTGFDFQPSGDRREASVDALRAQILSACAGSISSTRLELAFSRFPKLKHFRALSAEERDKDRAVLRDAEACLASSKNVADVTLLRRAVKNVIGLYDWHEAVRADVSTTIDWNQNALDNVRDAAMADNVLWLANVRYPGRKIILWLASFHAARQLEILSEPAGGHDPSNRSGFTPMGQVLARALGTDYFALALGVESAEHRGSTEGRYVGRSELGDVPTEASFIGLHTFVGPWGRIFDGALVFPGTTPPTPEP